MKLHPHFAVRMSEVVIGTLFPARFTPLRWAEPGRHPHHNLPPRPLCYKDAALPVTVRGKEARGPVRSGSGRLDVEAVLAVGKAV